MAELVDALVSNTNGSNPLPVRSRLWVLPFFYKDAHNHMIVSVFFYYKGTIQGHKTTNWGNHVVDRASKETTII